MKNKMLTLALSALLVAGTAIPSMALAHVDAGDVGRDTRTISYPHDAEVGVKKSFGGTNTYGFSWIDSTDNSLREWTQLTIGDANFDAQYGKGYAKSSQKSQPDDVTVSEDHGFDE